MEYLIGSILSLAVIGLVTLSGLERGRAFYPTVLIVIASYYVLFAAMGAPGRIVIAEILVAIGFLLLAVIGFKKSLWLVAVATAGHGVFDLVHHRFIENPGVPRWWPGFCMIFDLIFGGFLALRLITRRPPLSSIE